MSGIELQSRGLNKNVKGLNALSRIESHCQGLNYIIKD